MLTGTDLTTFGSFSIKCKRETIDELRATFTALQEPSYFSKKHWCMVAMDGLIPDKQLFDWLDISYGLVIAQLPKKIREAMRIK